ncbi:hypothetical protein ACIO3O_41730 [Streptomyces sp. NPDC087440]|uniref:hypothetical protein n=1 Tax=Streptomyces sp. NPDC087440 TaxID=3365790 RepID=UPI0037FB725B
MSQPDPRPEPPAPAAPAPGPASLGMILALFGISLTVLLIIGFGAVYLAWRHPSAAVPLTVGAAVLGVIFAAIAAAAAVAALRRR